MTRFTDAATARGLAVEVHTFPGGTRTAADAAAAVGCEVGAIVKSLVFVVQGLGAVVVLTSGANRVDNGDARPLYSYKLSHAVRPAE